MRQPRFRAQMSVTVALLIALTVAFLGECLLYGYPPRFARESLLPLSWYGLKHGYVWQLVSFQFLHGGLWHLLFNCWAIFVFGRDLEEGLGRTRFLALYFLSGIIGGLVQALAGGLSEHFAPESLWASQFVGPVVGASAGAFGLVAAFATLYPERPLTLLLFFIIPVNMRAKFLLLFCALLAVFGILFPVSSVANAAHLGGMITGILFIRFAANWQWPEFQRRRQPQRRLVRIPSSRDSGWGRTRRTSDEDLPPEDFLSKEVDPILDKISAHGIQSLTERERRILEAARDKMGRR